MKKIILGATLLSVLISCSKDDEIVPLKEYSFTIDSVLTQTGLRSLPQDNNGFYRLKLDVTKNQSIHRITGKFLVNGKEPTPSEKVEWQSNLYWYLKRNDTIATITKTYMNLYKGQLDTIVLPPLIANKTELVPTINPSSYSGKNGEINIVIAPILRMKGDTLIVQGYNYNSNLRRFVKIILD
jgi:hypothetical protein